MSSAHGFLRLALAALLVVAAAAPAATLLPERVARAAQERVDAGEYPALVIGYIDGDKSEVDAFGKLDDGKAPDADTVFEMGSITKTFTATLLALEVKSGALTLDAPVASLLPGQHIPARNGRQITLLDLAEQHSGLPRLPTNMQPKDPANPYADYDATRLKAFLSGYELTRDPGQSYEYSNLGFGLLGFALAQHAHADYAKLLQERILAPLQMSASGVALSAAMRAHLAHGHDEAGKAAANWDLDALAGAGAIRSSAADMLRYLAANMGRRADVLGVAMKFAQEPRRDVSKDMRIGLAWMTRTHAGAGAGVVWHNGGTGGYRSFLGFTNDGKRGIVVLTNVATSVDDLGFAALLADEPLAPAHRPIKIDATSLEDYVGDYRLADNFLINVARVDGQLIARATGQAAFPMFPSAPNEFFAKVAGISMSFTRDANGKVAALVLHQNGDRVAPRLGAAPGAPAAMQWISLGAAALQDYTGKFQLAPGAMFDVTIRDDQLYVQLTGQAAYPVYEVAKNIFRYKVVDAQLDFERDAAGKVIAVTLHQNGIDQRAPRVQP